MVQNSIIFIAVILIIIAAVYFYSSFIATKTIPIKTMCDKKGCPIGGDNYDIYKIHLEQEPARNKNKMLITNKKTKTLFSKIKGPANIFIKRHGEKIKTELSLDCNGLFRSANIHSFITRLNEEDYGIDAIITSNDYTSMHQEQTVMLASWLYNIPLYIYSLETDTETTIKELFTNPFYDGKNVLICWQHNCIQSMIKNIISIAPKIKGITNYEFKNPKGSSLLPYWDHFNYDSYFHFDEKLNFKTHTVDFKTCFKNDNHKIKYKEKLQEQNCT